MTPEDDALLRRGLRLQHLRLAAALADLGGVSAAGAVLGLSQPAASRLVAELEGVVGAPLYRRHARGVALTDVGALFAARAKAVLALLRDAGRDVAAAASGGAGRVAVGSVTAPAVELLAPALRGLHQTHPDIRVSVQVDSSRTLMRGMTTGALDFVIGRVPEDMDPAEVAFLPIGPERLCVVARPGHPLAGAVADPAALAACDWVLQPQETPVRRVIESFFLAAGAPQPVAVAETASLIMTVALLARSDALAAMAEPVVAMLTAEGAGPVARVRTASPMVVATYGLIRMRRADPPPPVRTVWEAVARAAAG